MWGWRSSRGKIGVPDLTKLPRANTSPEGGAKRGDLTREQVEWIETRFKRDREFIERHADRLVNA